MIAPRRRKSSAHFCLNASGVDSFGTLPVATMRSLTAGWFSTRLISVFKRFTYSQGRRSRTPRRRRSPTGPVRPGSAPGAPAAPVAGWLLRASAACHSVLQADARVETGSRSARPANRSVPVRRRGRERGSHWCPFGTAMREPLAQRRQQVRARAHAVVVSRDRLIRSAVRPDTDVTERGDARTCVALESATIAGRHIAERKLRPLFGLDTAIKVKAHFAVYPARHAKRPPVEAFFCLAAR